ncbi:hypothetical protein [Pseudoxanthomonas dokdonensis]|uniref:Membrane protein n=1 Tax=Pseudoxanthomonas dokdonensis TaxID=344882 RepID=A0A0R0CLJ2_9GAMM|nr:hypothetical protein [Pseudoxanthomonas dokdonensis]KRG70905.1 membrane protein [Pseudoxanthomonas dokdonensis]
MWARALAGVVPGFFLSAAVLGLFCWGLPGPWQSTLVPGLVAFFPIWTIVIAASFKFADGRRAWAWLSALAVLAQSLLWALQASQWLR